MMQFTEEEDAKFWPIYREYETQLAKINDDRIAVIKEYAVDYEKMTDDIADRLARTRARSRGATARAQSAVLRPLQVRALREDGRPVSSGGTPDPAAPRPPDRGVAADRPVTHRDHGDSHAKAPVSFSRSLASSSPAATADAVGRSGEAPVRPGGRGILHERRRQDRPRAPRQRPDRGVPGRRRCRGGVLAAEGAAHRRRPTRRERRRRSRCRRTPC